MPKRKKTMRGYLQSRFKRHNIFIEMRRNEESKPEWVIGKGFALFMIIGGILGVVSSLNDIPMGAITFGLATIWGLGVLVFNLISILIGIWRLAVS